MARINRILAVSALAAGIAVAQDGFNLVMLTDPQALCLDGSQAGFYKRNGTASSWVIELEGGGWCISLDDCVSRSKTDIGSSKSWPPTGCPGMDGGSNGMLSNNCNISAFCNWTAIHMNYCDGASFAGTVAQPVNASGTMLYFRGRAVLDATLDALFALGMDRAQEVIIKGCSAGGLATILHLDYMASRIRAVNPGARVVGMPDAGFFMDHNNYAGQPSYTPLYQAVSVFQNTSVPGSVNDACLAHYTPLNEAWKCFMAQYTLPFITTPFFMTQDLSDSWQMSNIFNLPCNAYTPGSCNATIVADIAQYRSDMLTALQPLLSSPTNGGFLSACVQHCHQNIDVCYDSSFIANQSVQTSFLSWYTGGNLQRIVVDGPLYSNPTCLCSPYDEDSTCSSTGMCGAP